MGAKTTTICSQFDIFLFTARTWPLQHGQIVCETCAIKETIAAVNLQVFIRRGNGHEIHSQLYYSSGTRQNVFGQPFSVIRKYFHLLNVC